MTTIVFKNGIMAADSRCSSNCDAGYFVTNADKLYQLRGGALLGGAGDDDIRDMLELLSDCACAAELPSRVELAETNVDFAGVLALPDGTLWLVEAGYSEDIEDWYGGVSEIKGGIAASGTGAPFALGALYAGATAEKAVEVACRLDPNSDGPVQVEQAGGAWARAAA